MTTARNIQDCYHRIAVSILRALDLSLEIKQIYHRCSLSNLPDLRHHSCPTSTAPYFVVVHSFFNGQQCLMALQVRKVTFSLRNRRGVLPCTNQSESKALHRERAGEVNCPIRQLQSSRDRSVIFTETPHLCLTRHPHTNWFCYLGCLRKR